ncbi:MAG: hypothetical protein K2Z80_37480 [Xanthobacteraceae bacterium]|nr:hypothetical protein [Xanthobacteraceae bacterium]
MQAVAEEVDEFTGDPPTREENERADRVQSLCDFLALVARGDDTTAWVLSNVLESVDRHCRDPHRIPISTGQRDRLLMAVVRAHVGAEPFLSPWFDQRNVDRGMKALAAQIILWSESGECSRLRGYGRVADLHAYARIFRNQMHNLSLAQEIAIRAHERRESCVHELLTLAHSTEARRA